MPPPPPQSIKEHKYDSSWFGSGRGRDLAHVQSAQASSGAHPTSWWLGNGVKPPGREPDHSSHLVPRLLMSGSLSPGPICLSAVHSDDFTCTLSVQQLYSCCISSSSYSSSACPHSEFWSWCICLRSKTHILSATQWIPEEAKKPEHEADHSYLVSGLIIRIWGSEGIRLFVTSALERRYNAFT
jgi:hypothetical protein